jgi:hypothetical protein
MKRNLLIPVVLIGLIGLNSCVEPKKIETKEEVYSTISTVGDSVYILTYGGLEARVDAKNGGRLESLSLNGENVLSGKDVNAGNWGTSLWPSPQSAWGWPPSQQLDNFPYAVISDPSEIIIRSQKDPKQGFVFNKTYKINVQDTSLQITYVILNESAVSQKVAPWEISRVAPGGLTFYPSGEESKRGLLAPLTKDSADITWFEYNMETIPQGVPKLLADGKEGWMAQVSNGLLLVKSFDDVPTGKYAPEEGEIEMYANPDHSYIEIEQQGNYVELKVKEELKYIVTYKLVKLPSTVPVKIGNVDLLRIARAMKK